MNNQYGYVEGEICNRKGCKGVIQETEKGQCSCHINPPCSACTEPRGYCVICGWDAATEERNRLKPNYNPDYFKVITVADLDKSKINWILKSHTHFSQICEGVYPEGTTLEEVREKVKGTFGGRFEHFGGGTFKYIAYTD